MRLASREARITLDKQISSWGRDCRPGNLPPRRDQLEEIFTIEAEARPFDDVDRVDPIGPEA